MELKIPIEVDFDDLKSLLDDLGQLQKYKLFEGDEMVLVDINDVADVLMKHIKAKEAQPKTGKWSEKEVLHKSEAETVIEEWQSCKCSVCGRYDTRPYLYYFDEPPFCSWCGARMRGE